VGDAERADEPGFVRTARKLRDPPRAAQPRERAVDDGKAGGVVAAVLEALQAF
jgi:hypothetical protein